MPTVTTPPKTAPPCRTHSIILLQDGSIAAVQELPSARIAIYTPDEFGNYANGTWSPVYTSPNTNPHWGSAGTVHSKTGLIHLFGGHAQHTDHTIVSTFDPRSRRWLPQIAAGGTSHLSGVIHWNDGSMGRTVGLDFTGFDADGNWVGTISGTGTGGFSLETGPALIPDGRYVTPTWAFGQVLGNPLQFSVATKNGNTLTNDRVNATNPGYAPMSWMSGANQWLLYSEHNGSIWHPKIERLVHYGSPAGVFFCFNPVDNTVTIPAHCAPPADSTYPSDATIDSAFIGPTTFPAGTVISWTLDHSRYTRPLFMASQERFALLQNGQFAQIAPFSTTLGTINGTPIDSYPTDSIGYASLPAGTVISYQLAWPLNLTAPFTGVTTIFRPWPTSWEDATFITPSGDLLLGAEVGVNRVAYQWDGTNPPTTEIITDNGMGDSNIVNGVWTPDGRLFSDSSGSRVRLYQPNGTPNATFAPIIDSFPGAVGPGQTVTLAGRQLHGRSIGAHHGDDWSSVCNYPIVRFRNTTDHRVYWGRAHSYSTRSIEPNIASTCAVDIPSNIPPGSYEMTVISAGNPSPTGVAVQVISSMGSTIHINPYGL